MTTTTKTAEQVLREATAIFAAGAEYWPEREKRLDRLLADVPDEVRLAAAALAEPVESSWAATYGVVGHPNEPQATYRQQAAKHLRGYASPSMRAKWAREKESRRES